MNTYMTVQPNLRIDTQGNLEPTINDLLDDPVTWAMMARDRISRQDLLNVIESAKQARSQVRQAA